MAVLLLVAAASIVYLNSLANGFALDDVPIIRDNPNVRDLTDLRSIWLKPYWPYFGVELGLWRPFVTFAYALQWAVAGDSPVVFHAVNIGLHVVVTVLAFLLLERLTETGAALAGAMVFAVHPVHTEAVANVVGQAELIAAAALIGACLLHATRPAGLDIAWPRRLALLALFSIAVLTKEHAVVLPALLLAVDLAQRRIPLSGRGAAAYVNAMLMPMLLLGCALLAYLAVRYPVLDGSLIGVEAGPQYSYLQGEHRVLNALRAFPEFLRLLVLPIDLSADYAPAMILPSESLGLMSAIGAVLLAATVVLALLTPLHPAAGFAAAWFLISIITVSNLLFPIGVFIAERTLYLPSFALSAAIAYGAVALRPRLAPRGRRAAVLLLCGAVVLMGVRTWVRNPDWMDTETVLYSILRDHPESYKAQWTQATWQWQRGNLASARDHYELATRLYAHDSQLLAEHANFLRMQGDLDRAIDMLETAFNMHPYIPRSTVLLAIAYVEAGRYEDGLRMTRIAYENRVHPTLVEQIRAAAYDGLGRTGEAVGSWRYLIGRAVLPAPLGWAFIGRRLAQHGYPDDALQAVARGLHAAADDSASIATLRAVETAIQQGCYAAGRSSAASGERAACDPLPVDNRSAHPLQSAIELQNAMDAPAEPPRSTAGFDR